MDSLYSSSSYKLNYKMHYINSILKNWHQESFKLGSIVLTIVSIFLSRYSSVYLTILVRFSISAGILKESMEGKSLGPSCSGLNLVTHPRAKSKVWKCFGFDTDADGCILHWKRIYCRICMNQIAYSGNTSNSGLLSTM